MLVLALDTCFGACSAALFDGERILASRFVLMERGHAEAIAPLVDACFRDAGLSPQQLSRIAVTRGPGTFTGLRIGLSLAQGMGLALGCEIVGLNSLLATAAPLLDQHREILVLHQAGATGRFYGGRISASAGDDAVHFATPEECRALLASGLPLIGTGADAFPDFISQRLQGHDLPKAQDFVRLATNLPAQHMPPQSLYLREPDAKPTAQHLPALALRNAGPGDIEAMAKLHRICFDKGWDAASLASSLSLPGAGALVLMLDGGLRAFLQYQVAADEAEIHTICSEPRWRNRGLASRLLEALLVQLRAQNITHLHLEVAADNAQARRLYERHGFVITGKRKGYYARRHGPVDAILMACAP